MIEKTRKLDFSYLLLCPYMMVAYIPRVVHYFQHRYIAPLMLVWLVIALASQRKVQLPPRGQMSLIAVIVLLGLFDGIGPFFSLFDHGEGLNYGMVSDFVLTVFPLLVFHLSVCNGRHRELRLLVIFGFVCVACSAAMTFSGLQVVEAGARALAGASGEGADLDTIGEAVEAGIGTYGHVYGMGLLIFPVLACTKFMPIPMKVFFTVLMILFLLTAYKAAFSILLIGIFLAGVLYLITKFGGRPSVLKIVGVVSIIVLVTFVANPKMVSFLQAPLQSLVGMTSQMEYQSRIDSVIDMVSGDQDSYAAFRADLYWKSWSVFLKHPLFGIGNYYSLNDEMLDTGGHSMVFDTLAVWGIFGLGVFILIFVYYYRYMQVMSSVVLGFKWWPAYYIFLLPFSAIAFINPIGGAIVLCDLFLLIPSLVFFFKSRGPVMGGQQGNSYPQQLRHSASKVQRPVQAYPPRTPM